MNRRLRVKYKLLSSICDKYRKDFNSITKEKKILYNKYMFEYFEELRKRNTNVVHSGGNIKLFNSKRISKKDKLCILVFFD